MTDEEIYKKYDSKTIVLMVLAGMDIKVISHAEKFIHTEGNYVIELEKGRLYKLLQNNQVIAPFHDVVDLCSFIKNGL